MSMCRTHWDDLRAAINSRGLGALVPDSGGKAIANLVSQAQEGKTLDNFDPLTSALLAIARNCLSMFGPDILLSNCPLCAGNSRIASSWQHARDVDGLVPGEIVACNNPKCSLPTHVFPAVPDTLDWMIDRAAGDQVKAWKKLGSEL